MLICIDCGHIFLEAIPYTDTHGLEREPYETWFGCPDCGGPFARAYQCSCCNEWIDGPYIKLVNDERICDNCYTSYEPGDED